MSLILDALRRADSERERGSVPTLHAQPAATALAGLADAGGKPTRASPRWWVGGVLVSAALLAGAWLWLGRGTPAPVPPSPTPPQTVASVTPPLAPIRQSAPLAVPAPVVAPPPPEAAAKPSPEAKPEAALPKLSELPEALRRELPALVPGGAMYSDTPAQRMLILNGQLFHEGDQVAPQLLLEQIQLRGAVLSFKGQRYTIAF